MSERGVREEHYLHQNIWKALALPAQPATIDAGSFKPLVDERLVGGRVIPRYPEGHILLMFWKGSDGDNPPGVNTVDDLKDLVTSALAEKEGSDLFRRTVGIYKDTEQVEDRDGGGIAFDEAALREFLAARPGRSHHTKLDRYHDGPASAALVGDAAHGMYTTLGQGLACALEGSRILIRCLTEETDLGRALERYSGLAVPEGHAASDLNLIGHAMAGGPLLKAVALPITLLQSLRGKMVFKRVNDDVSYSQILKENRLLVALSKRRWKKERLPFKLSETEQSHQPAS